MAIMGALRQRAQLCLLSLVTTSFAVGQIAHPEDIERLKTCEVNIDDARKLAESIAKSAEQQPKDKAIWLGTYGTVCFNAGRYAAGEPFLRGAVEMAETVLGSDHPNFALMLNQLALLLTAKGDNAEAESLWRRAIAIQEKALGRPDTVGITNLATYLYDLGTLLQRRGDYIGAEQLYRRALDIREKVLGSEHTDVATSLNNLGDLLREKGDYAGAESMLRRALAIDEKLLGPEHQNTVTAVINLSSLLHVRGRLTEAEVLCRQALARWQKIKGAEDPIAASLQTNLAVILAEKGDRVGAEELYRQVLATREKVLGPEHPDTAIALNNLGGLLRSKGDYSGAEPLIRRAFSIQEKVFGLEHPASAQTMTNLAALLEAKGDYANAEVLYRRALAIREKVLGPEHPDSALALNNLAELLHTRGDYAGAEALYRRALAIQQKVMGPRHPNTALALNNLAEALQKKGDYRDAEPLYREALAIREEVFGPAHPETVRSLRELAGFLTEKGDYADAEPLHRRALAMAEKILGPEDRDTAECLILLADMLRAKGDYPSAEPLYRRAVAIQEKIFGPNHPTTAFSLGRLAELLRAKGDYVAAEPLYRRALAICETAFGPYHHETATALNNLGALFADEGSYGEAEPLYRRALSIDEKVFGREHPDIALTVNNLAGLLSAKGDYAGAEPLFRQALAIDEQVLGPEHPMTAKALDTLASLLGKKGQYSAAEPLARRALAIREKVLGIANVDTATSMSNLAVLLAYEGNYAEAERLDRGVLAFSEKVLGPEHHLTTTALNNLAYLLSERGEYAAAEPFYRQALATEERIGDHRDPAVVLENLGRALWAEGKRTEADTMLARGSRLEATNMSRWLMPPEETEQRGTVQSVIQTDILIPFHLDQPQDKQSERLSFWALLQRQGRLQEIRALQQRLMTRQPELFKRWRLAQSALDACRGTETELRLSVSGTPKPECGKKNSDFDDRQNRANEALLALYAAVPRQEQDVGVVELDDLLPILRRGDWALIEIANYRVYRPTRPSNDRWGERRYAAYVLFADGRIQSKDLGDADVIDTAASRLRKLEASPNSSVGDVQRAGRELYDRTLGQFEDALEGQNNLYVAADGALGLVDFGSLVDRKGNWFLEEHVVANLTSGRDLVRLSQAKTDKNAATGDYLITNPSFLFKEERRVRSASVRSVRTKSTLAGPAIACSAAFGTGLFWPQVAITRDEMNGFRSALPGLKVYEREQARESVVKRIVQPRTMWFITHGFFCDNSDASPGNDPARDRLGQSKERRFDDPMARGALVLAGAQVGGTGDGEDGYLKGNEIVDRNWQGTELVVLGACETALGVPSIGDGVYGMRRAFVVAGVRSQVMTLWQVSQLQTFELLQAFANLLHQGEGKAEALRNAQRKMLREHPHPYYWAGFYFSGDPGPLGKQ